MAYKCKKCGTLISTLSHARSHRCPNLTRVERIEVVDTFTGESSFSIPGWDSSSYSGGGGTFNGGGASGDRSDD